jgi:hypothetical protein
MDKVIVREIETSNNKKINVYIKYIGENISLSRLEEIKKQYLSCIPCVDYVELKIDLPWIRIITIGKKH